MSESIIDAINTLDKIEKKYQKKVKDKEEKVCQELTELKKNLEKDLNQKYDSYKKIKQEKKEIIKNEIDSNKHTQLNIISLEKCFDKNKDKAKKVLFNAFFA